MRAGQISTWKGNMKTRTMSSTLTKAIVLVRESISRPPLRRGLAHNQQLPRTQTMWIIRGFLLIQLALACFALLPQARADCRQGCITTYGSTFFGDGALYWDLGFNNTAFGEEALASNYEGNDNTATGLNSLFSNIMGSFNTADGSAALATNTTGIGNTATGQAALNQNNGSYSTADGLQALVSNTTGNYNTACGLNALFSNTTGSNNTALGSGAGGALTTGSDNIDIGHAGSAYDSAKIRIGTKPTHKNTYIAGIYGVTVPRGLAVIVDSSRHLGTNTSSARFKDAIKPMDKASEAILALQPVTFRYKKELDPDQIPQFGLVAEDVAKVNPDLVERDEEGKPYTVRYDAVNAMLLNEFLKAHAKLQQQQATIEKQQKQIQALTTGLQKVSDQLELKMPSLRTADNH